MSQESLPPPRPRRVTGEAAMAVSARGGGVLRGQGTDEPDGHDGWKAWVSARTHRQ